MKKNILLTGKPKTGKTFIIKKLIKDLNNAGGFYTEAIYENNKRTGFKIVTLDKQEATLAHQDLTTGYKVSKYNVDIKNLENIGVNSILKTLKEKNKDIIIIDEIGKMEVLSLKFQDAVLKALDSQKRVVGVITEANLPFIREIKRRNDIEIVEATIDNRDRLADSIKSMIAQ